MERVRVIIRALTGQPEPGIEELREVQQDHTERLEALDKRMANLERSGAAIHHLTDRKR
jgi:hypothetical protein